MMEMLTKIQSGIPELFPGALGFKVDPDTLLGDIPEWDSMSSVNFKVFLEETFGISIPDDLLEGESSIADVIEFIRTRN
jgi:acyl carrier protein